MVVEFMQLIIHQLQFQVEQLLTITQTMVVEFMLKTLQFQMV